MNSINWFEKHKRIDALPFMSIFRKQISSNGYYPELNFRLINHIFVGILNDCYFYYNSNELEEVYKKIQNQIRSDNFLKNYKKKELKLHNDIEVISEKVFSINLSELDNFNLKQLYEKLIEKFISGPLFSVQLFSLESFQNSNSVLYDVFEKLAKKTGQTNLTIQQILQTPKLGTAHYEERKLRLKLAKKLKETGELNGRLYDKYFKKYACFTSSLNLGYTDKPTNNRISYVLDHLPKQKQFDIQTLLNNEANSFNQNKLDEHIKYYDDLIKQKNELLKFLNKKELKYVEILDFFSERRDFSKVSVLKAFIAFCNIAREIAKRNEVTEFELKYYTYEEILNLFSKIKVDDNVIESRKKGWMLKFDTEKVIYGKERLKILEEIKSSNNSLKGTIACKGFVKGIARVIENKEYIDEFKEGEILVVYSTTNDYIKLFSKARGIIAQEGGITTHTAIVSREFNIPCIIGVQDVTKLIKTGDLVEVDADNGVVRKIKND